MDNEKFFSVCVLLSGVFNFASSSINFARNPDVFALLSLAIASLYIFWGLAMFLLTKQYPIYRAITAFFIFVGNATSMFYKHFVNHSLDINLMLLITVIFTLAMLYVAIFHDYKKYNYLRNLKESEDASNRLNLN